jgi:hypothetical protein
VLGKLLNWDSFRHLTEFEHGHLKLGPECVVSFHCFLRDRLNHVMDVTWSSPCMRPQTDVDLIWFSDRGDDPCRFVEHWAHRCGFVCSQLGNSLHVTFGFDNQRSDTKRTDAVLDNPSVLACDQTTWQDGPAIDEVTGETILLVHFLHAQPHPLALRGPTT